MTPEEERRIIEEKAMVRPMRRIPKGSHVPVTVQIPAMLRLFLAVKNALPPDKIAEMVDVHLQQAIGGDVKSAELIRKICLPDGWLKELTKELPEAGRVIDYKASLVEHLPKIEAALDARAREKAGGA